MSEDALTDMLRVLQVKSSIDLIQNVHRRWLELQERHDQRQRNQGTLSSRELCQALLPHLTKAHLDFKAFGDVHVFRRLELAKVARQQISKDRAKVTAR